MPPKRPLRTLPVALATAKHAETAAARRRPKPQHVPCTGRTRAGSATTKQSNRKGGKATKWGSWRGGADPPPPNPTPGSTSHPATYFIGRTDPLVEVPSRRTDPKAPPGRRENSNHFRFALPKHDNKLHKTNTHHTANLVTDIGQDRRAQSRS